MIGPCCGLLSGLFRSYGLDLVWWFRFLWAIDVCWDRATRVEARDFCRWLAGRGPAGASALASPGRAGGHLGHLGAGDPVEQGLLGCFALTGYAAPQAGSDPSWPTIGLWFLGAVIAHDLVLFPLYALADRSLGDVMAEPHSQAHEVL